MHILPPRIGAVAGTSPIVLKLDPGGQAVLSTTYIGGPVASVAGLAVGQDGTVYLAGNTSSSAFPAVSAAEPTFGGRVDAFVLALAPSGNRLLYSTFLGGKESDTASAIAVDPGGSVAVVGETQSQDFPVIHALQQRNHAAEGNRTGGAASSGTTGFVTRLDPAGQIVFSTYLGGYGDTHPLAVATDPAGDVYVGGWSAASQFPIVNALQPNSEWFAFGFLTVISPTGDRFIYSTHFGDYGDRITGIALDPEGNVYVAGEVANPKNYPAVSALQPKFGGGGDDAFAAEVDRGGRKLIYSTFLGGTGNDQAIGIAVDAAGEAYVAGSTTSLDFPVANAVQPRIGDSGTCSGGCADAFVAKLAAGGGALVYSTYLGGSEGDYPTGLAVTEGRTVLAGFASSGDFPLVRRLQSSLDPNQFGGFLAEISDAPAEAIPLPPRTPVPTATPVPVPCPAGLEPSSLTIRRAPAFPADFLRHAGPLQAYLGSTAEMLALYHTICGLPAVEGVSHCPIDFGASYSLTFYRGGALLLAADADPGGCRRVTIDESGFSVRSAYATTDSFWSELASALGLPERSLFPALSPFGDITGETYSHGVGIALGLDQRGPYPNALVRGEVLVENGSNAPITIVSSCGHGNPWAEVRDRAGRLLDPPAVPPLGARSCPHAPLTLPARQYVDRPVYLVLRGRRLAAVVTVRIGGHQLTVRTKVAKLGSASSYARPVRPAQAVLHRSPSVSADLVKPAGASGPLLYTASFSCPGGRSGWRDWTRSASTRLVPPCPHPSAWPLVAGWVNHPVAAVSYIG